MKKRMRNFFEGVKNHWKKADAQDLVEYALLVVLVSLAAVASVKTLGQRVSNVFVTAKAQMVQGTTVAGSIVGIGTGLATGSNAAADTAAAGSLNALASSYAAAAQAALNSGNIAAAFDLGLAAAADGTAAGLDGAAATQAAKGVNGGFGGSNALTAAANAALAFANNLVNAAAATIGQ